MSAQRTSYPAGVPCWVEAEVPDVDTACGFYGPLLGWTFEDVDGVGERAYRIARLDGRAVAAVTAAADPNQPARWVTSVSVEDLDASLEAVAAAGGSVVATASPLAGLARTAEVADPDGAVLRLWEPGSLAGAQTVNVPGSWNFSDLDTHDPASAATFYTAVFGWEAEGIVPGMDDVLMLCQPGYGAFLDRLDPGRAELMASAPEGFTDAVAWCNRFDPDGPGTATPRWSITFSVDDTDAAVARAEELGGRVVTPPEDVPPVRLAVVADPHGAVLTLGRFAPDAAPEPAAAGG